MSDKARFNRILRRAFHGYVAMMGKGYGVSRRPNFAWRETSGFKKVPPDLIPSPTQLPRLPFDGHFTPGLRYETLLVEPPIFLNRLRRDLAAAGVPMKRREFSSSVQVAELRQPIVINCTGLGSRKIWPDDLLMPIKGQLIMLPAQPQLQYLYSGHRGYIFPRRDHVVVGGTIEPHVDNDRSNKNMCAQIIRFHETAFTGRLASVLGRILLPPWLYQDYD